MLELLGRAFDLMFFSPYRDMQGGPMLLLANVGIGIMLLAAGIVWVEEKKPGVFGFLVFVLLMFVMSLSIPFDLAPPHEPAVLAVLVFYWMAITAIMFSIVTTFLCVTTKKNLRQLGRAILS